MPATQTDRLNGLTTSIAVKAPVKVKSTGANLTLSSSQVIDGILCSTGDRVLVADQTGSTANGIYVVSGSGSWARAADFNGSRDCVQGTIVFVTTGTTWGNTWWQVNSTGVNIPDSSAISFAISASPSSGISFTTYAITLVSLSTASEVLQTLTSSTYTQTVLGATDSTTFRQTLEVPYDLEVDLGTPTNSAIAYQAKAARTHTWSTTDTHFFYASTPSSTSAATMTFSIRKNGTTVATASFGAAESTGTIAFISSGGITWSAGDIRTVYAPASIETTTLGDVSMTWRSIA